MPTGFLWQCRNCSKRNPNSQIRCRQCGAERPNLLPWFVFMAGEEDEYSVTRHPSYAKAVWEAQCRGCTEKRPKRLHAGFYELNGCSGKTTYFIATAEAMERQGYGDLTVLR